MLSYEEMLALRPFDIVHCKNLVFVSQTVSNYFKSHLTTADCGKKFVLEMPDKMNALLKGGHQVVFGLCIKDLSGSRITDKIKRIIAPKTLLNKLSALREMYSEVYFFARSSCTYVTDFALKQFEKKQLATETFLKKRVLISPSGDYVSTKTLVRSQSNKASELYGTCKQLEELAIDNDMYCLSAVITCPSKFHIKPLIGVQGWDGISIPKHANEFMNRIWRDTLRQLTKQHISPTGHWTKEANASGAIHRNVLLYCSLTELEDIKKWLTHYTQLAFARVNSKYQEGISVKYTQGHSSTIAANGKRVTSNILNYFNKHISAFIKPKIKSNQIEKVTTDEVTEKKCATHAYKHKYRRFGFFGLQNCLTKWRALKQCAKAFVEADVPSTLSTLFKYARKNELKNFLRSPATEHLKLLYSPCVDDGIDGNNSFGEKHKKVFGVKYGKKNYYASERHLSLYDQLLNLGRLKAFFAMNSGLLSAFSDH